MENFIDHAWHVGSWEEIAQLGSSLAPSEYLVIRSWSLSAPNEAGFYWLPGFPKGTLAQWRRRLADDSGVHVYVYPDRIVVHRDRVDPSASLLGHLVADCPGVLAAGAFIGVAGLLAAAGRE